MVQLKYVCATIMHHLQLNYSYTVSLHETLMLSTHNVSQFVSQHDVSAELLSIGEVGHGKCLYTYLYISQLSHLSCI